MHDYSFAEPATLACAIDEFRTWGWRIVVADVADVDNAVGQLAAIHPDMVQVDMSRRGGVDAPAVLRFLDLAKELGASVMALSVNSPGDRETAVNLGATYARGRLIGPPGSLPTL